MVGIRIQAWLDIEEAPVESKNVFNVLVVSYSYRGEMLL